MHSQFQKYNLNRQPNWRYERALELTDTGGRPRRPRRYDDDHVVLMRKFLIRWEGAERRRQLRERLFNDYPGLYYAFQIYTGPDEMLRLELEARILAGMDDVAIAKQHATLPQTIAWYEAAFFNVRDRLHVPDWVHQVVLQPALQQMLIDPAVCNSAMVKLFAYHGGPLVLEALTSGFRPQDAGESAWNELNDYFDSHIELQLRGRLAMASHALEVNKFNFSDLMGSHAKLKELQIRSQTGELEKSEYSKNVQAVLARLEVSIGNEPAKLNILQMHQDTAAELRSDEQLQLAYGLPVEGLAELAAAKFPGRTPKDDAAPAGNGP